MTHYYVYYKVSPDDVPRLRAAVQTLFKAIEKQCGVHGRWMHRRDDPSTYMEVYEEVKDAAGFGALIERGVAKLSVQANHQALGERKLMCLILLAWQRPGQPGLVAAANRDEFHARAAAPAAFWPDQPTILAGRDLEARGTWMGISRGGRFAAVTNYRGGTEPR